MAPTRLATKPIAMNENMIGITTRSKQMASLKGYKDSLKVPNKRKADSPLRDTVAKRAAFGDLTNAFNKATQPHKEKLFGAKKVTVESKMLPTVKCIKAQNTVALNGKTSKAKQIQKAATNALESVQKHFAKEPSKVLSSRAQNGILKKNITRKSLECQNSSQSQNSSKSARSDTSGEPSLYTTALDNISPADSTKEEYKTISEKLDQVVLDDTINRSLEPESEVPHHTPDDVTDFDKENWSDPYQVSTYAMDIFNYLKGRERLFPIDDYLQRVSSITSWMRALLVDWMVEVQESFELNHETLYLAVKLVDLFLTRASRGRAEPLSKEELQLLGASALFIASKFDERIPPLVDDFLYICDGAYNLSQLLRMETRILREVDFDLGVPLSYRFLRRYARCARVSMPTLTLARFVLELCLLEYRLCSRRDSRMAAAALYLALKMKALGGWTPALQYYTGYTLEDILPLAIEQNAVLHQKPKSAVATVRNKYSHTIFFEVAKVPLLDDKALS